MKTRKWFDRKFDFNFDEAAYVNIYDRLKNAPNLLYQAIIDLPEKILVWKPQKKWSVKEHAGHLSILEILWRTRIPDILENRPALSVADLTNKATDEAGFNDYPAVILVEKFMEERKATLAVLDAIDVPRITTTSLHPRLQQPMRLIDHLYFVAEHDAHHMEAIGEIVRNSDPGN